MGKIVLKMGKNGMKIGEKSWKILKMQASMQFWAENTQSCCTVRGEMGRKGRARNLKTATLRTKIFHRR